MALFAYHFGWTPEKFNALTLDDFEVLAAVVDAIPTPFSIQGG